MGRPRKDAFDEDTSVRVLRAAEQIFADHGFADARLEDIAAFASIRRSSLLYHFGSKDKLYQQVVGHAFAEIAAAMARGMGKGKSFEDKIEATVDELLSFQKNHETLMSIVFRSMLDPQSAGHESAVAKFTVLMDQLEQFVVSAGRSKLPRGLPVRAILMHLLLGPMARAAMGEAGDELWRGDTQTRKIARLLFLGKR